MTKTEPQMNVEVPEYLRVQAALWVFKNVSHDTVIDANWYDYLYRTQSGPILKYMLLASGLETYEDILASYEGYKIPNFVEEVLLQLTNPTG